MGCPSSKEKAPGYAPQGSGMGCIAESYHEVLRAQPPRVSVMTGSWEVPRERLDDEHCVTIGEGAFGIVYETSAKLVPVGKRPEDVAFEPVVVKKLVVGADRALRSKFLTEIQILKELDHKFLVALRGVVTMEEPLLMILEGLPVTLHAHLLANRVSGALSDTTRTAFGHHIAQAMEYLAGLGVVHRDLVGVGGRSRSLHSHCAGPCALRREGPAPAARCGAGRLHAWCRAALCCCLPLPGAAERSLAFANLFCCLCAVADLRCSPGNAQLPRHDHQRGQAG